MAGRRLCVRQRGAALLIFMMLAVTAALTYVVNGLTAERVAARRTQNSLAVMVQARDALIGYAQRYREEQAAQVPPQLDRVYGYLPLPDLGTSRNNNTGCLLEGCDAANFSGNALNTTVIGRLPWRTLGLGPLKDGHGECLWYAVSGSHQRQQRVTPMNWDTLAQLDIVTADGTAALASLLTATHDRPVAIIFSAGPPLPGQNRSTATNDDVGQCGGNYEVANYLDPRSPVSGIANHFSGATPASGVTGDANPGNDPDPPKAMLTQGKIFTANGRYFPHACNGDDCVPVANDTGHAMTGDGLFGALRQSAYFRTDLNALLERMTGCLRDDYVDRLSKSQPLPAAGRIGASACYADSIDPRGYFSHYAEMIFVAPGATISANGQACHGALIFASQRAHGQRRDSAVRRNTWDNYLEGINLASLLGTAGEYSGPEVFGRVAATHAAGQDIVRCIPTTPNLVTTASAGLAAAGIAQLASYTAATRTLNLGYPVGTALPTATAGFLYGCAWQPEVHAMGGGLRSYFTFRIVDIGGSSAAAEGFTFAIVDGDNNGPDACGGAAQHLGYAGNNRESAFIVPPKLGVEIDPRASRDAHPTLPNFFFDETVTSTLANGRNDPETTASQYRGGHVALVYWGGDTAIDINPDPRTCVSPRIFVDGQCSLAPEEDDNVHGQPANARTNHPAPPANPAAPDPPLSVPPDTPAGVYKLDPSRSQVPTNRDFHVRVELTRRPDSPATFSLPQARVATTGSLNLAAPGDLVDGIRLFPGDRVLVKDQVNRAENGVYVWTGGDATMTRDGDFATPQKLTGAFVTIRQGSRHARTVWQQSTANPVLGADALHWHEVRVKLATTQAATHLASPGDRIDNLLMRTGDRVLVKDRGIYVWQGPTQPMIADSSTASGMVVQIQQGSDASSWWRFDGLGWQRPSVRVATLLAATPLATPGPTIDGVTMAPDDLVLVKDSGLYRWHGATVALTPVAWPVGGLMQIQAGTDAGRAFRQTGTATWQSIDGSPRYLLEAWLLPDSATTANQITAMKNTTRPMRLLAPDFTPHLRDTPTLPYSFRNVRLGFTVGQRTTVTDQSFAISNAFTTWIE